MHCYCNRIRSILCSTFLTYFSVWLWLVTFSMAGSTLILEKSKSQVYKSMGWELPFTVTQSIYLMKDWVCFVKILNSSPLMRIGKPY